VVVSSGLRGAGRVLDESVQQVSIQHNRSTEQGVRRRGWREK